MDEAQATKILGPWVQSDGELYSNPPWVSSANGDVPGEIELDGTFSVEELEAMVWWLRNKTPHR